MVPATQAAFVGWAAGGTDSNGAVLLATTNGTDWFRQGIGQLPNVDLGAVCSAGTGSVWLAGGPLSGYGAIYYSGDDGATWTRQGDSNTIPNVELFKAWAVNDQVVWVVGYGGTVLRTVDGGANWEDVSLNGHTQMLQAVTAYDAQTAWVSGGPDYTLGHAAVYYTSDGGAHWMQQHSGYLTNVDHILGLNAVNYERVWAIGGDETILFTDDNGTSWTPKFTGTLKDGNEIYTRGTQHVWAACDSRVLWSADNGTTWTNHTTADYTMDISAPDGTNIWAVRGNYDGGTIYYSPDGGANWTNQLENTNYMDLFKLAMEWRPEIPPQTTFYVDAASPAPAAPYATWATAATNIQDAVDLAPAGATVLVTNGVYNTGGRDDTMNRWKPLNLFGRVFITNDITVRSVNGPDVTMIVGQGPSGSNAVRCAYLRDGTLSGFTLTNGHVLVEQGILSPRDSIGGGVFAEDCGTVSNCVITGCDGSGVTLMNGPQILDCVIEGNDGYNAGGLYVMGNAVAARCRIIGNTATDVGGEYGIGGGLLMDLDQDRMPSVINCFIAGNFAASQRNGGGGGVYLGAGELRNCTILHNRCSEFGGGLYVDQMALSNMQQVVNNIIYYNTAPYGNDTYIHDSGVAPDIHHNCAPDALAGTGNITNAPFTAGVRNPHILAASPCRGAGDAAAVLEGETDIDGEDRLGTGDIVDIGCDQYHPGAITGTLTAAAYAEYTNVVFGAPFELLTAVAGKAEWLVWSYDTGSGTQYFTNAWEVGPVFTNAGRFEVVLWVTNESQSAIATTLVTVAAGFTNYVSPAGSHAAPFTNWVTAATNIQAAVDACYAGGVTMVDSGRYVEGATIHVLKPMTLRGAWDDGGLEDTVIDGQNAYGGLFLDDDAATVEYLTFENGNAYQGGGVLAYDGTVRHCAMIGNRAERMGGGARMFGTALIEDCALLNNVVNESGGGLYADDRAEIKRCRMLGNVARNGGGGAWIDQDAVIINSFMADNRAYQGGGLAFYTGGQARNCTIVRNIAEGYGGGVLYVLGQMKNSIIYDNLAPAGPDNYQFDQDVMVDYCLTTPGVVGTGNITNADPRLAGIYNPHILPSSPCRNAGDSSGIGYSERDIDEESRLSEGDVDIGCDEVIPTNLLPVCSAAVEGDDSTVVDDPAVLWSAVVGKPETLTWTVAGVGVTNRYTNTTQITPTWSTPGRYPVILTASNLGGVASVTTEVWVVEEGFVTYAATNGAHVYPFTNWVDAATNVADAVVACPEGGTTLIGAGEYRLQGALELKKWITVAGAAAREQVRLDGGDANRVMTIYHSNAVVHTLSLVNGWDYYAGGLEMFAGTASNLVISQCSGTNMYGGVSMGGNAVLRDSLIVSNSSTTVAGLRAAAHARVINCAVLFNDSVGDAGGMQLENNARAEQCDIRGNIVHIGSGGGLLFEEGGFATGCTICSNAASAGAGAFFGKGGVLSNSTVELSWAFFYGAGLWFDGDGLAVDCRVVNNLADGFDKRGGGAIMNQGGELRNSVICSNRATRTAGVYLQGGGTVANCDIYANEARTFTWSTMTQTGHIGGVEILADGLVVDSRIHDNVADGVVGGAWLEAGGELRNCLVTGNEAGDLAGGVAILYLSQKPDDGILRNCTVTDNSAGNEGGGVFLAGAGQVINSIVYGNTAAADAEYARDEGGTMKYSCTTPDDPAFTATVTNDPQFAGAGDYRLQVGSPCINTGTNEPWMSGATDLDGVQRIIGAVVDMGAYEYPLTPDGFMAAGLPGGIRLQWNAAAEALSYGIWRAATATGAATRIDTVPAGTLAWLDDITCGQTWYYGVGADYVGGTSIVSTLEAAWAVGVRMDFDSDGKSDIAVYCPSNGQWAVRRSSDLQPELIPWGWPSASPVPGHFDQYCRTYPTVYWPEYGRWYGLRTNDTMWTLDWGWSAALPVRGDFDGDGLSDVAVYAPADGTWYICRSSDTNAVILQWGWSAALAVSGDFDGDGQTDPAVYAPDMGRWYIRNSSGDPSVIDWGWSATVPVVGDYDGDGLDDVAVFWADGGTWYIRQSSQSGALRQVQWGWPDVDPAVADYDGDGKSDIAVFWPSARRWFILNSDGQQVEVVNWDYPGNIINY
jgi:photosystem II stability/assembly factor-like uncharacterized protein